MVTCEPCSLCITTCRVSWCDSSMTPKTIPSTMDLSYGYPTWKRVSRRHNLENRDCRDPLKGTKGLDAAYTWRHPPHSASPPCRFATAGYPATEGSTGSSGFTHDPSFTGWACDHAPKLEENTIFYIGICRAAGLHSDGPRSLCRTRRLLCAISPAPTIYHLPSTCHLSYIICCAAFAFCA